jgi:hypothetical protein
VRSNIKGRRGTPAVSCDIPYTWLPEGPRVDAFEAFTANAIKAVIRAKPQTLGASDQQRHTSAVRRKAASCCTIVAGVFQKALTKHWKPRAVDECVYCWLLLRTNTFCVCRSLLCGADSELPAVRTGTNSGIAQVHPSFLQTKTS